MKLKQHRSAKKLTQKNAELNTMQKKLFMTLFTTAKTVSNRNPQSRGQGLSGESKAAILQLLHDDSGNHRQD